jgi:hypothetical protein
MAGSDRECSHEDLKYHDMDVGNPEVIYENWTCQGCGASIVKVYEPDHAVIYPDDGREPYRSEEVVQ